MHELVLTTQPGFSLNWIRTSTDKSETVVLIHAVGHDLTCWDRQIEALGRHYNVVAFDLPGHGRSTGKPDDWSFEYTTAFLTELIEHLDAGPVHLVGISFGSMIAQPLVLARPDLLRSLTLIGTVSTFSEEARDAFRERARIIRSQGMTAVLASSLERWFTSQTRSQRPDIMDRLTKTVMGDDPAHQAAIWDLIASLDVRERLGELRCPTLVLVGEQDASTPPAVARDVASAILNAEVQILPGAAHIVTVEAPDVVNHAILTFLERMNKAVTTRGRRRRIVDEVRAERSTQPPPC